MSTPRWLLIYYGHYWEGGTLKIFCTTDIACHMFLMWTDVEERVHLRAEDYRGLRKLGDPKYCFVQFREIEQNEAGDTLSHTFDMPGWVECITRWWVFRATIAEVESPSNTAIFKAHAFDQEKAFPMKHTALTQKQVARVIDHADQSVSEAKLAHDIDASFIGFNAKTVKHWYFELATQQFFSDLEPDEVKIGFVPLDFMKKYIFLLRLDPPPDAPSGGLIIAGMAYLTPDDLRLFAKNIGTEVVHNVYVRCYSREIFP